MIAVALTLESVAMRILSRLVLAAVALAGSLAVGLAGCYSDEAAPGSGTSAGESSAPSASPPADSPSLPTASPTSGTPATPPTAKVADTLCVRADQSLVRQTLAAPAVAIRPTAPPAEIGLPSFDVCELALTTNPSGPVLRMGISVLPATQSDLAAARKVYQDTRGKLEPAKPAAVGAGGFGTSRFVVFLLDGRLLKVSGPPATVGKYVALGREAARQAPGLPPAPPLITREECERGTSQAAAVMGAPAMARRDGKPAAGQLTCGWISTTATLSASARTVPDAAKVMESVRKLPTSESVPLGDDGFFDTRTRAIILRVGTDKIVDLVPLPAGQADKNAMIAFALAMSSVYTR